MKRAVEMYEHYNKVEQMPDIGISPTDFPVINCEKALYIIISPFSC